MTEQIDPATTPVAPSPTYQLVEPKTTKDKWWDFLYYHWQVVLIIGLCIGSIIMYQINVDTNKKLQNIQSLQGVAQTVQTLDAKVDAITKNNADLYPKLEAKIADLEQARLQFKAAEARLKQPTIGDVQNENANINENEISRRFNALGFGTVVK